MAKATQRIPTSIKLEKQIKQRINHLAEARHRSSHSMMIEAINQYLEREERLEQFRDEMEDVWIEYQRTGLHATSEEVFAWMDSWFIDNEKPVPECHR